MGCSRILITRGFEQGMLLACRTRRSGAKDPSSQNTMPTFAEESSGNAWSRFALLLSLWLASTERLVR